MNAPRDNGELRDLPGPLVLIGAGKMGGALLDGWLNFGLDPRRIAVSSRSRRRQFRPLSARGLQLNPNVRATCGRRGIVIAVKPQAAAEALAAAGAVHCRKHCRACRSWPAGRYYRSLTGCRVVARWCEPCPICRPLSAAELRSRWRRGANAQQHKLADRPLVRDRYGRMDRRRIAYGCGDRSVGVRAGLCLLARRSFSARRHRGRPPAGAGRKTCARDHLRFRRIVAPDELSMRPCCAKM